MNIDEQPTQPLTSPQKQPINYHWLKSPSDASGVHLLHVHRFVQGKYVPEKEATCIRKTMQKLIQMGGEGEA